MFIKNVDNISLNIVPLCVELKQLLNKKNCITCKWSSYNGGFNYAYPNSSCLNSECEHYGIVYSREIYNMDCDNYVCYNAKVG